MDPECPEGFLNINNLHYYTFLDKNIWLLYLVSVSNLNILFYQNNNGRMLRLVGAWCYLSVLQFTYFVYF